MNMARALYERVGARSPMYSIGYGVQTVQLIREESLR